MCDTSGFWMSPEDLRMIKKSGKVNEYECLDCNNLFKAYGKKKDVKCTSCNSTNLKVLRAVWG
ncbi:MAG: hypothetical protein ACE5KT_01140 [Methanosarcinales archaeon]